MFRHIGKKIKFKILPFCVLCGTLTCCTHSVAEDWNAVIKYRLDDFSISKPICLDVNIPDTLYHAKKLYVFGDTCLIVLNNETADYFLEVYDMKNNRLVTRQIRKGNGPNEMLLCQARMSGDKFFVKDFAKGNYVIIDICELLREKESYKLPDVVHYRDNNNILDLYPVSEESSIKLNSYYFHSPNDKLYNNEPRFFYERDIDTRRLIYASNVSQGHIVVNTDKKVVVFCSLNDDVMEFYDIQLNPLTKISGPIPLDVRYAYDGKYVCFKNAYYGYLGMAGNSEFLYAIFHGTEIGAARNSYILKYNWEGALLSIYETEKYLTTISTSPKNDVVYVSGYKDGEAVLYEMFLP